MLSPMSTNRQISDLIFAIQENQRVNQELTDKLHKVVIDQGLLAEESLQPPMSLPASDGGVPVFDGTLAMLIRLLGHEIKPCKAAVRARGLVREGLMVVQDARIQAALDIEKEYSKHGNFRSKLGSMSDAVRRDAELANSPTQNKRIEDSSEQVRIIRQSLNSGDGRRGAAAVAYWYRIWSTGWPPERTIKKLVTVMGEVTKAVCAERSSPMRRPRKSRKTSIEQGDGVCG